ncbi:MAG: hypothetical protein OXN85_05825 [Gemmatimonadetes bacterium]|nr:hypothetical protein [Candidatus Palauibacter australiensis]
MDLTVVGDAAVHHAAPGVGERAQFVGDAPPLRAYRTVAAELEFLEFRAAVFAEAKPLPDLVFVEGHRSTPKPDVHA